MSVSHSCDQDGNVEAPKDEDCKPCVGGKHDRGQRSVTGHEKEESIDVQLSACWTLSYCGSGIFVTPGPPT